MPATLILHTKASKMLSTPARKILFGITGAAVLALGTTAAVLGQNAATASATHAPMSRPTPTPMPPGGTPVLPGKVTGIVGPGIPPPPRTTADAAQH